LDESKLRELASLVGGSGMIVRSGLKAFEWGDITSRHDWSSASKPVLSTLLLMADNEGLCRLHSTIGDFLPDGSEKDRSITFFQLANMTSGYSRSERPGAAWAYNDHAVNLYAHVLCEEVFGDPAAVVIPERFSFLEFQDPFTIGEGRHGRITKMSVQDFARFGLFWMSRGRWKDTQWIPDRYFDLVTNQVSPELPRTSGDGEESWSYGTFGGEDDQIDLGPGHYGLNFWVNTNGLWPGVPAKVHQAIGHWGQRVCVVVPSMDLVAVGIGDWDHPSTEAIRLILEADTFAGSNTVPASPGPVNATTWSRLKSRYVAPK
jgi:CubicO group peptidase (beta-lactamase class C family)